MSRTDITHLASSAAVVVSLSSLELLGLLLLRTDSVSGELVTAVIAAVAVAAAVAAVADGAADGDVDAQMRWRIPSELALFAARS